MKHPEYDSPFELTMSDIATQIAKNIDENCWHAVQRVGINVDKNKLLNALRQDAERYREAYANGYDTGYEKRDEDIVRCENCKNKECWGRAGDVVCGIDGTPHRPDWFCADGERQDDDD